VRYTQRCADFPFAGALAKYLLSAEYTAMPVLNIDAQARQQIRQALNESSHCDVYALILLPDGDSLLMLAHFGNIAFCLIDHGDDLFDPHQMHDVGALVLADLERNRELIAAPR
jgi:hypothetical protein